MQYCLEMSASLPSEDILFQINFFSTRGELKTRELHNQKISVRISLKRAEKQWTTFGCPSCGRPVSNDKLITVLRELSLRS